MTDDELEQRLRAWYRAEIPADEAAPLALRSSLVAIPRTSSAPRRGFGSRRGITLLAAAALIGVISGVLAFGGILRERPAPSDSRLSANPSVSPSASQPASPTAASGRIVYTRWKTLAKGEGDCTSPTGICHRASVFISNDDGSGERELFPGPYSHVVAVPPDGSKLIVSIRDSDGDHIYLTDADGSEPRRFDTQCHLPCLEDWGFSFSADGSHIAFVRAGSGEAGPSGEDLLVATMDVTTGVVVELESTRDYAGRPGLSPDGGRVAFGNHVVDADGSNLGQIAQAGLFTDELGAFSGGLAAPQWAPNSSLIAFTSFNDTFPTNPPERNSQRLMDIYVVRPDGTGLQRLTTDTVGPLGTNEPGDFGAGFPTWTRDGRIVFSRYPTQSEDLFELWVMDADGSNATQLDSSNAAALTALGCVTCPYPGTTYHDTGIPSFAYWIPGR